MFSVPDSFRSAELVRGAADVVAFAQTVGWQLADPLRRVAEKRHFPLPANRQRLAPGLQHAGFVVRGHDRHQPGTRMSHLFAQPVQIHHSVARDGNQPMPVRKVMPGWRQEAGMFDR